MKLTPRDLAQLDGFAVLAGRGGEDRAIGGAYVCDLLSWAMSGVSEGDAWVTVQGHVNVVAVAALTGAACVILADGAPLEPEAQARAETQGIPVLTTKLTAYQVAKLLASYE